jgi:hypothetical protein
MTKRLETAFVKPCPGGLVRKGLGQPFLKESGEDVPLDPYWLRRLRMGDVVRAEQTKAKTEAVEKTSTQKGKAKS